MTAAQALLYIGALLAGGTVAWKSLADSHMGLTFDELNEAYNDLRNKVMGRGTTKPANVSTALYTAVGNAAERWQKFYPTASALDQVAFQVTAPEWLTTYRNLASQALDEGVQLVPPMQSTIETAKRVGGDIFDGLSKGAAKVEGAGRAVVIGALALAVPLGVFILIGNKRNERR